MRQSGGVASGCDERRVRLRLLPRSPGGARRAGRMQSGAPVPALSFPRISPSNRGPLHAGEGTIVRSRPTVATIEAGAGRRTCLDVVGDRFSVWRVATDPGNRGGESGVAGGGRRAQAEDMLIQRALQETGGNIADAARLLGVNRTRICRKLAQEESPAAN